MGTQIRLVFYAENGIEADSIAKLSFERIDDLNSKLSDYIQDSELNRLCLTYLEDVEVSTDLHRILKIANRISTRTNGAFDVSAGPLVRLWRDARKSKSVPKNSDIKYAKQNVGYTKIEFSSPTTIRLAKKDMQLDLGGIGKGYAADEVLKLMEQHGISAALIDMGGDIRVSGPPGNKAFWNLAFSYYDKDGEEQIKHIQLKHGAVATSGDLYQFVEIDGKRYSHIIDPNSGWALSDHSQVTVIADTATRADAFASAFSVLGIKQAKELVPQLQQLELFMVQTLKGTKVQWQSPEFGQ